MAALPSRSAMDALVNDFFATPDMGCGKSDASPKSEIELISWSYVSRSNIHERSQTSIPATRVNMLTIRQYHRFWINPSAMPITWIGMLFCILSLSVQFSQLSNKPLSSILAQEALRDPQDAITSYREKGVQCLVLGNYTEPGPYTVETLFLYYVSDHFRTSDAQFGSWMIFGLIVRAAMRLGYHRDASHFPKISAFKGEVQRRLWHMIVHLDLISSLQIGLPRMILENSFDTQKPRNLLDEDFDEHTIQLPPQEPTTSLQRLSILTPSIR